MPALRPPKAMRDPLEATGLVAVGGPPPDDDRAPPEDRVRGHEETARRRVEDFAATLCTCHRRALPYARPCPRPKGLFCC